MLTLRIHWRISVNLKTSKKCTNVFWYVKVCILWKCIQYTMHWDKIQMLQKFSSDKISSTKVPSSFFHELQFFIVLFLVGRYYMRWSTRYVSLKPCVRYFVFDSVSFLLKIMKYMDILWLLNVIIFFKIKTIEKTYSFLLPDLWFLSCNKKF